MFEECSCVRWHVIIYTVRGLSEYGEGVSLPHSRGKTHEFCPSYHQERSWKCNIHVPIEVSNLFNKYDNHLISTEWDVVHTLQIATEIYAPSWSGQSSRSSGKDKRQKITKSQDLVRFCRNVPMSIVSWHPLSSKGGKIPSQNLYAYRIFLTKMKSVVSEMGQVEHNSPLWLLPSTFQSYLMRTISRLCNPPWLNCQQKSNYVWSTDQRYSSIGMLTTPMIFCIHN